MRRRAASPIGICIALFLAACSGSSGPSRPPTGRAVFAADCGHCHSLIGNESLHRQGGDLLGYTLSRGELAQFVREMPLRRALSAGELEAVIAYVLGKERSGRRD